MKVERDWDDGRLEYEVEFIYNDIEYQYTIDGTTGEVRGHETEPVRSGQSQAPAQAPAGDGTATDIGADASKAAALSHAGLSEDQVSRLKVESDWDDGRLEYEVEFHFNGYEYQYTISGTTGTILEHEIDWDD